VDSEGRTTVFRAARVNNTLHHCQRRDTALRQLVPDPPNQAALPNSGRQCLLVSPLSMREHDPYPPGPGSAKCCPKLRAQVCTGTEVSGP
jgi:hypothetical protein